MDRCRRRRPTLVEPPPRAPACVLFEHRFCRPPAARVPPPPALARRRGRVWNTCLLMKTNHPFLSMCCAQPCMEFNFFPKLDGHVVHNMVVRRDWVYWIMKTVYWILLFSGEPWLTAAIPVGNPYCSCKLTRLGQATCSCPLSRASCRLVMACSCNPYGEPLLQL